MTNIEKFLKKIGVPSDAINKLNTETDDVNIEDIAAEYQIIQRDVLKNNPDRRSRSRRTTKPFD